MMITVPKTSTRFLFASLSAWISSNINLP
jgi:hypothetical protein